MSPAQGQMLKHICISWELSEFLDLFFFSVAPLELMMSSSLLLLQTRDTHP